jgi:hypothetical protein
LNGFVDLEIVCADGPAIRCHRLVVCSAAKVVKVAVLAAASEEDDVTRVLLPDHSRASVAAFVADLYEQLSGGVPNYEHEVREVSEVLNEAVYDRQEDKRSENPAAVFYRTHCHGCRTSLNPYPSSTSNVTTIDLKCKVDLEDVLVGDDDEEDEDASPPEKRRRTSVKSEEEAKLDSKEDEANTASVDDSAGFLPNKREKTKKIKLHRGEKVPVEEMRRMVENCTGSFFPVRTNKNAFEPGKKKDRYCMKNENDFLVLCGVARCSKKKILLAKPLAWTAPKPEQLPEQLESVRRAFQLLYGHSDADVYFHPWMFSKQGLRQTMNHPVYKMQQDFLRKNEHTMTEELQKMLEGEELISMQERTAQTATLRFSDNSEHQLVLKKDLATEEFDGLALLMRQKRSICYSLRTVHVVEERQEEFCDLWMRLLFDTWRHSSVHIPKCDYFLDKYKEYAECMIVPQCVEKLLGHKASQEHHKQCTDCGQLFPYVTMKQIYAYRNHMQRHVWDNFKCDCGVTFSDKAQKRRHYQMVHDEKRKGQFKKCDQCCYVGRATWLERHMREFHRDYVCHICGKVSANKQCHRVHVRDHYPATCEICEVSFVGFWRLKVHRIREHRSPLNCDQCSQMFKTQILLREHVFRYHQVLEQERAADDAADDRGFQISHIMEDY